MQTSFVNLINTINTDNNISRQTFSSRTCTKYQITRCTSLGYKL